MPLPMTYDLAVEELKTMAQIALGLGHEEAERFAKEKLQPVQGAAGALTECTVYHFRYDRASLWSGFAAAHNKSFVLDSKAFLDLSREPQVGC
jgi:hypothetical protein